MESLQELIRRGCGRKWVPDPITNEVYSQLCTLDDEVDSDDSENADYEEDNGDDPSTETEDEDDREDDHDSNNDDSDDGDEEKDCPRQYSFRVKARAQTLERHCVAATPS